MVEVDDSSHPQVDDYSHPKYKKLRPSGRFGERGGKNQGYYGNKFGKGGWGWDEGETPVYHDKHDKTL